MKAVLLTAAFVAAAIAFIAAIVFGFGDRRTFVAPPEAVVEGVVRALECRRFPQALKYFTAASRARLSSGALEEGTSRLEARVGRIEEVAAEESWMAGEEAESVAVVRTAGHEAVRLRARLRREKGEWRVIAIEGLTAP